MDLAIHPKQCFIYGSTNPAKLTNPKNRRLRPDVVLYTHTKPHICPPGVRRVWCA
jgi:hypothetical protein